MIAYTKEDLFNIIKTFEENQKCIIKCTISKEKLNYQCKLKDCKFKLICIENQEQKFEILQLNIQATHSEKDDQDRYQVYNCLKEFKNLKQEIQSLVQQYLLLSPKPILKKFLENCNVSYSLRKQLSVKNSKCVKKFDNIVNKIKRINSPKKNDHVQTFSEKSTQDSNSPNKQIKMNSLENNELLEELPAQVKPIFSIGEQSMLTKSIVYDSDFQKTALQSSLSFVSFSCSETDEKRQIINLQFPETYEPESKNLFDPFNELNQSVAFDPFSSDMNYMFKLINTKIGF